MKCCAVTLAAAALAAAVFAAFGARLLALLPHGSDYAACARLMPLLTIATALTACQVFFTNAEVSAGRFGFLAWLVPLHVVYPAVLWLVISHCGATLGSFVACMAAAAAARFAFAAAALLCQRRLAAR